jgi:hypothetical protein
MRARGFGGNRRRTGRGELIEPATHMRPAEREFDSTALGERNILEILVGPAGLEPATRPL